MRRWVYRKSDIEALVKDKRLSKVSPLALSILQSRGYNSADEILKFLYDGLDKMHDTRLMKDAALSVDMIRYCIDNDEEVVLYTDYDCDGGCGGSVGFRALKPLLKDVHIYANNRFTQGYGLCKSGIDEILIKYPNTKLIITIDNGIMAHEGIQYAKSLGLKVIVTDHHEEGKTLPNADAIVDPKRKDCEYPFKGLCGTGVIFKLMLLLYWELGRELDDIYDLLDIVAVGTVGDIVPLVDENRIIVKEGLLRINNESKPIFRILREVAAVSEVNSHYTLAYVYVPMINAIGRLDGNIDKVFEMFISDDEDSIMKIVLYLKELNEQRKAMTVVQCEIAEEMLLVKGVSDVIVLYNDLFHEGIVGLIAGRLKEKYHRPTVIFSKNENGLKGSARSIDGLHLKDSFDIISEHIIGYGGHGKAAGLSISEEKLVDFENAILKVAKSTLSEDALIKKYFIDYTLKQNDMNLHIVDDLAELEPFGEAFPKPTLMIKDFAAKEIKYMGEEKNHVKLISSNVSVIIWQEALKFKERGEPMKLKVLGYPSINIFRDNISLQFTALDDNFRSA